MSENFHYSIGSYPDRENLEADIRYKSHCWAIISTEELDNPLIEFYPPRNNDHHIPWEGIALDGCIETLQKAMTHLDRIYTEGSRLGGKLRIDGN